MMKNSLILILILFSVIFAYSEKWVGQVATYQLLDGSKMANGELFNPENLSAACNGFKLGASVNVINVKTGKSIEVTVTDRIRSDSNYFILLTPKAAKSLELEWETSLVVIDGSFTDVNSTEILAINGLISEGSVDEEKIKTFPDVKWPDDDKDVTKRVFEKDDDKENLVDPKKEKSIDPAKKENKISEEKDPEIFPKNEKNIYPEKIMQKYAISEDLDDKLTPKNDLTSLTPKERDNILSLDKEEKYNPEKEVAKIPERDKNLMGEDLDDGFDPKKDISKIPERDKNLIGEDLDDKINPKKDITKTPERDKNLMGEDKDDKIDPNKDISKEPFKKERYLDDDKEDSLNPKKDISKNPRVKEKFIEKDSDVVYLEKEKTDLTDAISWIEKLPKDKIFVRFSTTFEKEEGERRFSLFKDVIKNLIAYKDGNKYILLTGPLSEAEIDKTIRGLRNFGYKDAYVVKGF